MDVFDLVAKIRLDDSEYRDGVGKAKGTFSSLASGIKTGLATVAKIGGAAIAAGAAGVTALTKMGVEGYAQYEQLVGGVETLFKESGNAVMQYAENAYKTSGLSANAYMETVTSFSASLIQSLDGDTAKAAQVADMAITDMSDNANKMGTSMEMIQNAYQGFSKQNYTMLDNLKLGYGGTKTEMERLLKDAQKISGIKYDISSYSDVVEAIHVMQVEMGIAGTTAKEAASTIQGSLSMMKGAWQNLVVGMADENADMETLIGNFVESTVTAAENLLPRISQTLAGIGQLVEGLAPVISSALPTMVESILPSLLNAAVSLVTSVFGALPGLLESLLPVAISAVLSILDAIIGLISNHSGQLLQTGFNAILQLINGLTAAIPNIITAAVGIITQLVSTLTSPESLTAMLNTAVLLLETIVTSLIGSLPMLIGAAIQLVQNLVNFITEPGNLQKLITMALNMVKTIMNGLVAAIPQLVTAAVQLVSQLVQFLLNPSNIGMLLQGALQIVLAILEGLLAASGELITGALALIETLFNEFVNADWKGIGETIINTLLEGLKAAWESVSSWFSGVWNSLFDKDVSVTADSNGNVKATGHATGLNYVPYDEYPALLHRGEAVLTSIEAAEWRKGQKPGVTQIRVGVQQTADTQNERIISLLTDLLSATVDGNEETVRAVMTDKKFVVGEREFGRLVKQYA